MSNEYEWEAQYTEMMRDLPEDKMPSALLEERTVRVLRSRGLLRRQRWIPPSWVVGSVAASIALFATGVVVGQWMGTRNAVNAVVDIANNSPAAAAAQVQQTGTAYVQALEALVSSANQTQGQPQNAQAREVALTALHAAANEVVRLAPNDPVAAKILQGIEQARRAQPLDQGGADRKIVWF